MGVKEELCWNFVECRSDTGIQIPLFCRRSSVQLARKKLLAVS